MLSLALALFSAAVLIGIAIALRFLANTRPPSRAIAAVHGLFGVAGLAVLAYALIAGVSRGDQYGTASFGPVAAVMAGLAVVLGLAMALVARRTTRHLGVLIGVHASIAIFAYVLLLAYVLLS
jgi:hypothetical protein